MNWRHFPAKWAPDTSWARNNGAIPKWCSGVFSIISGADNYQYCRFNALPINDCPLRCLLKIGMNIKILFMCCNKKWTTSRNWTFLRASITIEGFLFINSRFQEDCEFVIYCLCKCFSYTVCDKIVQWPLGVPWNGSLLWCLHGVVVNIFPQNGSCLFWK